MTIEEFVHMVFDESNHGLQVLLKNDVGKEELLDIFTKFNLNKLSNQVYSGKSATGQESHKDFPKEWRIPKDLSFDNVIGQIEKRISTMHYLNNFSNTMTFIFIRLNLRIYVML